jgi:integrase
MADEGLQLHDRDGRRKYLTAGERAAFLEAAERAPREVRAFCLVHVYTGSGISEALALTADRVDLEGCAIILETLKKRRRGAYRVVPAPSAVIDTLNHVGSEHHMGLPHAVPVHRDGHCGPVAAIRETDPSFMKGKRQLSSRAWFNLRPM